MQAGDEEAPNSDEDAPNGGAIDYDPDLDSPVAYGGRAGAGAGAPGAGPSSGAAAAAAGLNAGGTKVRLGAALRMAPSLPSTAPQLATVPCDERPTHVYGAVWRVCLRLAHTHVACSPCRHKSMV